MKIKNKKTVFVGMSGGVDSAVSAALLQKQGYNVVGVFIKTWHPDFLACNEENERRDAMRICAHLNIPFLTFDLEKEYKKEVADYMIAEYKAGRTPNPDVMCNKHIKFGAFFQKALSMGADYVATGHYAKVEHSHNFSALLQPSAGTFRVQNYENVPLKKTNIKTRNQENFLSGRVRPQGGGKLKNSLGFLFLSKGIDSAKDQSYFLWTLNQKQLSKILFPIGHLKKSEVRKLAKKFKLPVAEKKDSQGICFLGAVDLKNFLKHYIKEKKGKVLDEKGKEVGYHSGVVFLTLGERHGFTITKKSPKDGPYYVIAKDIKKNILYVSQNKKSENLFFSGPRPLAFAHPDRSKNKLSDFLINIKNTNWILSFPITYNLKPKTYTCQIRYHGELLPCQIICSNNFEQKRAKVIFKKPILVAPGQSIVIYDKNICLGGGIVA